MKQSGNNIENDEKANLNNESLDLELLNNDKIENIGFVKQEKWYTKFKGILYCFTAGILMAISGILIKKSVFFSGFEQAAV